MLTRQLTNYTMYMYMYMYFSWGDLQYSCRALVKQDDLECCFNYLYSKSASDCC